MNVVTSWPGITGPNPTNSRVVEPSETNAAVTNGVNAASVMGVKLKIKLPSARTLTGFGPPPFWPNGPRLEETKLTV